MIDRVFTKAEARYIPNGDDSIADMAHPTRTGDVVAFSYPPYQFDAATPGTLIARSAFFGQHGYVPDVQDLKSNTNMRATFLAGGDAIDRGVVHDVRSIDLAPTAAFLLDIPVPQHSQGTVLLDMLDDGHRYTPVPIIGLNDFHGQLDAASATIAGRNTLAGEVAALSVGGAGQLATLFDEEAAHLPGETLLLAAGDNVGASPPNSALLQRHSRDRRREPLGYGRDELRQPRVRLRARTHPPPQRARRLPIPVGQHHRGGHRSIAVVVASVDRSDGQRRAGRRDRGDGQDHARSS